MLNPRLVNDYKGHDTGKKALLPICQTLLFAGMISDLTTLSDYNIQKESTYM